MHEETQKKPYSTNCLKHVAHRYYRMKRPKRCGTKTLPIKCLKRLSKKTIHCKLYDYHRSRQKNYFVNSWKNVTRKYDHIKRLKRPGNKIMPYKMNWKDMKREWDLEKCMEGPRTKDPTLYKAWEDFAQKCDPAECLKRPSAKNLLWKVHAKT